MIIIVAPYSPVGTTGEEHLGAARKLEIIVSILSRIGSKLVLVNSAHNGIGPSPLVVRQALVGPTLLTEITPPLSASRKVGKIRNIFLVKQLLAAIDRLGRPSCIWLYNGYAFEMRFAELAWKQFHVPMIFEFEDWHFSRARKLNPKPYIDYYFWRRAAHLMTSAYVVNEFLAHKMRTFISDIELLPGLVPADLILIAKRTMPFSDQAHQVNVGYFGGLSIEKGADIVLKLASTLPDNYVLHVTGSGQLEAEFISCARIHSNAFRFHGRVDNKRLYELIGQCDVILNPHSSIVNMSNGVFPFKVIEAVASGRLLISTAVPQFGLGETLMGVQFVQHSAEAFHSAIVNSRQYHLENAEIITKAAAVASLRFGEDAVLRKLKSIINRKELDH